MPDQRGDLLQSPGPVEMPVGVHHPFEIINVQKEQGKRYRGCSTLGEERFQGLIQIACIVETSHTVLQGQGLDLVISTRIFHSNGDIVRNDRQEVERSRVKIAGIHDLENPEGAPTEEEGNAQNGPGGKTRQLIDPGRKKRTCAHIRHHHRLLLQRHLAGNAFAGAQAQIADDGRLQVYTQLKTQFTRGLIQPQQ